MAISQNETYLNLNAICKKLSTYKRFNEVKYSDIEYITRLDLIPYKIIGKRKYYDFDVFLRCYREIQKLKRNRYCYNEMKPILNKKLWYVSLWN